MSDETKKNMYRVYRTWEMSGWNIVEAESREDAEAEMDRDDTALPENGDYVGGSCSVDYNLTEELNVETGEWAEAQN